MCVCVCEREREQERVLKTSMSRSRSFKCSSRSYMCHAVLSYCAIYVPENEHVTLAQLQVQEAVSAVHLERESARESERERERKR